MADVWGNDSTASKRARRATRFASPVFRASLVTLRLLPEVDKPLAAAVVLIALVRAALAILFLLAAGSFVGLIPNTVTHGLGSAAGRKMILGLAELSVLFVVSMVLPPFHSALAESLGRRLDGKLRGRLMRGVLAPVGIAHLEDPSLADRVSIAEGVGPGRWTPGAAVVGLADNLTTRLQVIGGAVILSTFRWWLGAAMLICGSILRSRLVTEGSKRLKVLIGQAQALRRADYVRDLGLNPEPAKEVRLFGLAGWVLDTFTGHWLAVMSGLWKERKRDAGPVLFWFLPIAATTLAGAAVAGRAAISGEIEPSQLVVVLQAILLAGGWTVTNSDLLLEYGAAAVAPALDLEEAGKKAVISVGSRSADGLPKETIAFEAVAFRYAGRTDAVFTHLDLEVPAGRSLAIVGQNGAGKTTLIKLLTRLHDPDAGSVRADGVDLRELDPASWRRRIAVIFQDFVRYEMTVADNVAFGGIERMGDTGLLEKAAGRAGAIEVIEKLPDRWNTILSRQYEGGADLSGGEWQKIALARALFAVEAGAKVLVLDEPTSNLDVRAEAELFDRFLEITEGLTTILISHRFSSVRRADRICVMDQGSIVETGTHESLMSLGGIYARTFELQASRFKDVETPLAETEESHA